MKLPSEIKELCKELGISQKEAEKILNISKPDSIEAAIELIKGLNKHLLPEEDKRIQRGFHPITGAPIFE